MDFINKIKKLYPDFTKIKHTEGTVKEGKKLQKHFNIKSRNITLVCALHDIGKTADEDIKNILIRGKIPALEFKGYEKELGHALFSEFIAGKYFNVKNKKVLFALRYHPVGHPEYNDELLVLYIADYIEENRNFTGVSEARKKVYGCKDIKSAALYVAKNKLMHLKQKKCKIHPLTLKFKKALSI